MSADDGGGPRVGRVARAFMALCLPRERRGDVLGDLEEGLRRRADRLEPVALRLWYVRQLGAYAVWGLTDRWEAWRARRAAAREDEGILAAVAYDVRYAGRSLRRAPLFTAMAALTLALGIGGNTAVFSVVDSVLLEPLPYPEPDRLVAIHETFQGDSWWSAAPRNMIAWRQRSETLSGVAWSQTERRSLTGAGGEPVQVGVAMVSANYLDVLGVPPELGRGFRSGEDMRGAAPVTVLTHAFWRNRLGGDPGVVGSRLTLDGIPHQVVGILPPGRAPDFVGRHDLLVPRVFTEAELTGLGRVLQAIGRLAPGVELPAARQEMDAIAAELDAASTTMKGWSVLIRPLRDQAVGEVRPALLVLLGAVAFVLLVACVNVGNLFLARGTARRDELALRTAIGASRGRLVRMLLMEAGLVALLGGALGLPLAVWGTDTLLALAPGTLPRLGDVAVDGRVLGFCLVLSLGSGLLFGLVPALHARRAARESARTSGLRTAGDGRRVGRLRFAFVAIQVAAVLVLLVGAGLMLESFRRLQRVDPGYPLEDRLVLRMSVPETRYADPDAVATFFEGLVERLRAVPGVEAAGAVTHAPLSGDDWTGLQVVESLPEPGPGEEPIGGFEGAGAGYFDALGVPVLEGRTFTAGETADGAPVVVVNDVTAARFWPDRSPLGDRLRMAPSANGALGEWHTVIGVVGAARYWLDAAARPRVYVPERRLFPDARERNIVIRTEAGGATALAASVRAAVRDYAPEQAIAALEPLETMADGSLARTRLQTALLGAFAVVGLLLGAIGVYGVVRYAVGARTREIGVRLAMGARRRSVVRMVVARALRPVLAGLAAGIVAALVAGRLMAATLFDVSPYHPGILAGLSLVLLLVAGLAALLPARRASGIEVVRALSAE